MAGVGMMVGMIYMPSFPQVSPRLDGRSNTNLGNCYSGFLLVNDGQEYEINNLGNGVSGTTWLDSGSASEVWAQWVKTSGSTWNSSDPGSGRLQLSTSRTWRLIQTSTGIRTITGYVIFWPSASGGSPIYTSATVSWQAENTFDPCPTCCFTPETLITLASGIQMPIGDCRKGDMIQTANGPEAITGVITRTNRVMYRLHFENRTYLDTSDDHPLDVKDKGPASIAYNDTEYKDLPCREKLEAGDLVTTVWGDSQKIIRIEPISYPGTVYTFENSLFYANGLLVY